MFILDKVILVLNCLLRNVLIFLKNLKILIVLSYPILLRNMIHNVSIIKGSSIKFAQLFCKHYIAKYALVQLWFWDLKFYMDKQTDRQTDIVYLVTLYFRKIFVFLKIRLANLVELSNAFNYKWWKLNIMVFFRPILW